jgi:cation-transporting P-type ATPase E
MPDGPRPAGLTSAEVAERHASGRGNDIRHPTSRPVADILRENILTLFNGILTVCFVALLVLGDLRDGFFYLVVIVNAAIGIIQELRAKLVLDRAALLAAPECVVKRDGTARAIALSDVVIDDLLVLRPGDQLPADACVCESTGLSVDESMLTGESEPIYKDVDDELLSGSHVVAGTGYAIVNAVGADSYASKLTAEIRRHSLVHSELRDATNRILVYLSWILGPLIVVILIGRALTYGVFEHSATGSNIRHAIVDTVASVVGVIPEGLVLLISLAFGVAAIRLASRKVLVQELAAVEVLARVDVLCLDKTGTLTNGALSFDRLVAFDPLELRGGAIALAAFGADDAANATAGILSEHFTGDEFTVERRIPFSSASKFSGVSLTSSGTQSHWLLGAPERVLSAHLEELAAAQSIAALGHRTVALVRCVSALPSSASVDLASIETRPAALAVFAETIRPEAPETLRYFQEQGVRVVVMSGDNPVTVAAVAAEIGLTGTVLDASLLADEAELEAALQTASIFGRISPEQKRAAVGILRRADHTVAMTGDGVNDAMAIKDADLGIAMGSATAATKAVSRLVLLDNRFDRLPDVLALGRRVIANVERVANIFLAKTVYGIILALTSAVLLLPFPFLPRQLTLVSGLAIGIPSFVLAVSPNQRLYTPGVLRRILSYSIPTGAIAATACIASFTLLVHRVPLEFARTDTTLTLFCVSLWILCVLARPLNWPRFALLAGLALAMALICWLPASSEFFSMDIRVDWASAYAVSIGIIGALGIEIFYRFARRHKLVFDRV